MARDRKKRGAFWGFRVLPGIIYRVRSNTYNALQEKSEKPLGRTTSQVGTFYEVLNLVAPERHTYNETA